MNFTEELKTRVEKLPTSDPIFVLSGDGYYGPRFKKVAVKHTLPQVDYLDTLIAEYYNENFDPERRVFRPNTSGMESRIKSKIRSTTIQFVKYYLTKVKNMKRPRSSVLYKFFYRDANSVLTVDQYFQIAEFIDQHSVLDNIQSAESKELGALLMRMRKNYEKSR